jgi:hypothetical protein
MDYFDASSELEHTLEPVGVPRLPSTDTTRAGWAEIKNRRIGPTWEEGKHTYKRGPNGITVLNFGH